MVDCQACENVSGIKRVSPGPAVYDGKFWMVDHCFPTILIGWLVIVLKRHDQALHRLTREEFLELALMQQRCVTLLSEKLHCQKEYVACFSESPGFQHIHFHIIPRFAGVEEFRGPQVFNLLRNPDQSTIQRIIRFSEELNSEFVPAG